MPDLLRYLSHPQVQIDPDVPVPDWGLSNVGRSRTEQASQARSLKKTTTLISSSEQKAIETADILSAALNLSPRHWPKMHENDRSATGFQPPDIFEETANRFFEQPHKSIDGWERAIDAQTRIVSEVTAAIDSHLTGDLLIVGHGGVGTLLYCFFAGVPISRAYDQPGGGGNFFTLDLISRKPLHPWRPMEEL